MILLVLERPQLSFCHFWERLDVLPIFPPLCCFSTPLRCPDTLEATCTVPKCHRGSLPLRKLDLAPWPQPASPPEYHQLVWSMQPPWHSISMWANGAMLPCDVSPGWPRPSREQHSSTGRRGLFQTMISLTGWSRTKITPHWSSAETVSSHLYIMALSHSPFVWLPRLYWTWLPRLSGELILPRAGCPTLG